MSKGHFYLSGAFGGIITFLAVLQAIRHPKKVKFITAIFCALMVPAVTVNILAVEEIVRQRYNSLCFLFSSILLIGLNYYVSLDIGYKMQIRKTWIRFLGFATYFFLSGVIALLVAQIVILLLHPTYEYPVRWIFITSIGLGIGGHISAFMFAFLPLVRWRRQRAHEAQSRTAAYGIWFFSTQTFGSALYGAIYFWFITLDTWAQLQNILAWDYSMRYLLCIVYIFAPPVCIIDRITSFLSSSYRNTNNNTQCGNNNITYDGTLSQNIPDSCRPTLLADEPYNVFGDEEEAKLTNSRTTMIPITTISTSTTIVNQKPEPAYTPSR